MIQVAKKRRRRGLKVLRFPEKPDRSVKCRVDVDKIRIPDNPWCFSCDSAMLYFEYRGNIYFICRKCGHIIEYPGEAKVSKVLRSSDLTFLGAPPELEKDAIKFIDLELKRVEEEVKARLEYSKRKGEDQGTS